MSMTPAQAALAEGIAARTITSNRAISILPLYLSGFVDTFLLGVIVCQSFSYLQFVKTDKKRIIAAVALAVACTISATIDVNMWLTHIFVWHYGQFLSFAASKAYVFRYLFIDLICTFVTQLFYVDRAWRLQGHWWALLVTGIPSLASLALGACLIAFQAKSLDIHGTERYTGGTLGRLAYAWNGTILLADVCITVVTLHGLYKNRTGWKHTDSLIKGLIVRAFEAQIPALLIAIITLIFWNTVTEIALVFLRMIAHTKVYAAGMLATLNFRDRDRSVPPISHQSYDTHCKSSYMMSDIASKPSGGVTVIRGVHTVRSDHGQLWDVSRRARVTSADLEQASIASKSSLGNGPAHPDQAEQGWGSMAALNQPGRI